MAAFPRLRLGCGIRTTVELAPFFAVRGVVQKLGLAGNSEIDARTCDLRRWNRLRPRNATWCGSGAIVSNLR
jgi:hypothetical protein